MAGESPHASMKRSKISEGVREEDSPSLSISVLIKKVELEFKYQTTNVPSL
jgi:hypothetical protein